MMNTRKRAREWRCEEEELTRTHQQRRLCDPSLALAPLVLELAHPAQWCIAGLHWVSAGVWGWPVLLMRAGRMVSGVRRWKREVGEGEQQGRGILTDDDGAAGGGTAEAVRPLKGRRGLRVWNTKRVRMRRGANEKRCG